MDLDADRNAPWQAPKAPTVKQTEGMLLLSGLRTRWMKNTDAIRDKANGAEVKEVPALAARPRLVTDPKAPWEQLPAPTRPALPQPEDYSGPAPFAY